MRVAKNHDAEARRRRIEIELCYVVENIDEGIVNREHLRLSDSLGPPTFVIVATHNRDRSQPFEALDDFRVSHIACVNNEIAAAKNGDSLRSQETVGVRNETNAYHDGRVQLLFGRQCGG